MQVFEKLGAAGSEFVSDALHRKGLTGLTSAERASLREDLEKIEALLDADETELRVLVLGPEKASLRRLMLEFMGQVPDDFEVRERLGRARWYRHESQRGAIHLLDARSNEAAPLRALEYHPPAAIVLVLPAGEVDLELHVGELMDALEWTEVIWGFTPEVVAAIDSDPEDRDVAAFRTQQAFKSQMVDQGRGRNAIDVVQLRRNGRVVSALLPALPPTQRYSLARLSSNHQTRIDVTDSIIRLCSSINASIATISLPMASSVPITSIQILMIAGIAYVSGRDFSLRTIGEFLAAIGLNVGAGYAFRELARSLVGFVPVAGSLISASIAGGATITLGKAAQRYFLHD